MEVCKQALPGLAGSVSGSSLVEGRRALLCVGRYLLIDSLVQNRVTLVNQHRICVGWGEVERSGRRRGRWRMCQKNLRCLPEHRLLQNSVPGCRRKSWLKVPAENRSCHRQVALMSRSSCLQKTQEGPVPRSGHEQNTGAHLVTVFTGSGGGWCPGHPEMRLDFHQPLSYAFVSYRSMYKFLICRKKIFK